MTQGLKCITWLTILVVQPLFSSNSGIDDLFKHARHAAIVIGNPIMADSLATEAIEQAKITHDKELIIDCYFRYLEVVDLRIFRDKSLDYCSEAERIATQDDNQEWQWRAAHHHAQVYAENFDFDRGLEYGYKAFSIAEMMGGDVFKGESHLVIGKNLEGKNQMIEAYRNYLNALTIAESIQDDDLSLECYRHLSNFYNMSKHIEKATEYKLQEAELVRQQKPVDSTSLVWINYELEVISFNANNNVNHRAISNILRYAERQDNHRLKANTLSLYRAHLIEANELQKLADLYEQQYPEELAAFKNAGNVMYHRLMAYIHEANDRIDSANESWVMADTLLQSNTNPVFRANFYIRFGQFLARQDDGEMAIPKFESALELASTASYFQYMMDASEWLQRLYAERGDYAKAYENNMLFYGFKDSLAALQRNDEMLVLEIDNETRLREMALEREERRTTRRHNLQYMGITILIAISLIGLAIASSRSLPEWVVRMIGFFVFIFLFEFIILLADKWIHSVTHGEPWKVILIKIGLIAILLPLHHWSHEKALHVLIHSKVRVRMFSFKKFFMHVFVSRKHRAVEGK